ncbi:MAG: hypothetical protein ISS47_00495 [Candidatus Omnitrophica bacterium]|nr:hypothetical protein [Candidatus Omnitrophota bacterium]
MKLSRDLTLDKKVFNLRINWATVLAFVALWCYGYFGAISPKNFSIFTQITISAIVYFIFFLFLYLGYKRPEYADSLVITVRDIFVFLSYFIIMFILSLRDLLIPLSSDQISHCWYSQAHAIQLILLLNNKLPNIINNFKFANVLYVFNLLTVFSIIIFCRILKKRNFLIKIILLSLVFILFRVTIIKFWGAYDLHPALRLFPLWLSSSIFSGSNLSFRLPQFLGLVTLMWLCQKVARDKLIYWKAWLFGLCIGTMPLLWHVGTLAELSIWTAIIWALLLLTLSKYETLDNFNWIRWVSLISIVSLMRQTAFLGLIPLFLIPFLNNFKLKNFKFKKFCLISAPILVMLPFLVNSFISFTPYYNIQKNASGMQRVLMAVTSGAALKLMLNTVTLPWLIFLPLAFFMFSFKANKIIKNIAYFVFFIFSFYIFYSIDPNLWSVPRHGTEYALPFVIVGFYIILIKTHESNKASLKLFIMLCFIFLILFNIYTFKSLYRLKNSHILSSQDAYSYDEATKAVKQEGYAGSCVISGGTYGVLTEIINGFTVSEVSSSFELYKEVVMPGYTVDFGALNGNKKIKLVLISDMLKDEKEKLIPYLLSNGWKRWRDFRHPESDFVIYGFRRM